MKQTVIIIALIAILGFTASCASVPKNYYNTQKGAAMGAGVGALMGQAIGRTTEGTLLGAGIGTLLGVIAGNAADQSYLAARDAMITNKGVVYYDDRGGAVEAIPVR